jgi:hypothetical protein
MAGTAANYMAGNLSIGTTSSSSALTVQGAIRANNDGSSVGLYVNSNGAVRGIGVLYIDTASGSNADLIFRPNIAEALRMKPNGNILIGTTTDVASSIVTMNSTTKGFLPPRGTNAQRNAIASPAVGLIFYCTDATEGLYIYTSSGWKSLTMV